MATTFSKEFSTLIKILMYIELSRRKGQRRTASFYALKVHGAMCRQECNEKDSYMAVDVRHGGGCGTVVII